MGTVSQGFSSPIKVRVRQPLSTRQGQSSAGWERLFLGVVTPPFLLQCGVWAGPLCVLHKSFTAREWGGCGSRDLECLCQIYDSSLNP